MLFGEYSALAWSLKNRENWGKLMIPPRRGPGYYLADDPLCPHPQSTRNNIIIHLCSAFIKYSCYMFLKIFEVVIY